MAEYDQIRPSAPPTPWLNNDQEVLVSRRKNSYVIFIVVSLLVVTTLTLVILYFTAFRVRNPTTFVNSVTTVQLPGFLGGNSTVPNANMTIVADVSVKNPNMFSVKFGESDTMVTYRGMEIGSGKAPGGISRAWKMVRMNITIDIIPSKIMQVPEYLTDFISGEYSMESFTMVDGHTKILNLMNKNVEIDMNCSFVYDVTKYITKKAVCISRIKL
ncbi:hypothetical protein ACFE04_016207 [Oxalis oulophora]